jgi:hypothetical protein
MTNSCAASDGSSATRVRRVPSASFPLSSSPAALGALLSFSLLPASLDRSNYVGGEQNV